MARRLNRYLVDTNVWLERLLDQARSDEVGRFLEQVPTDRLSLSDFTLHSIGVILGRLARLDVLQSFVRDVIVDGAVALLRLEPTDFARLVAVSGQFNLDFDDAYQYVAAEKYGLAIVSFDSDFDRTDLGRVTPVGALRG